MAYAARVVDYRESGSRASYRLNEEELKKILGNKAISSKKVALISVAGAFRKGKSFLLNFLVLYLEWLSKGRLTRRFFDENSSLEKFQWRGGVERDTNGIYLWSEPYLLFDSNGGEVAVFLMDTQGTFDHQSTVQDCATIFAMSTLLSSIQIFNISSQIQEDDLNNLRLFTKYAELACGQQERGERIAPFQKLLFLIRDWANHKEFPYGYEGGEKYLQKILEMNDRQKEENRELRQRLKKSFESMEAFLMPFPGSRIAFDNSSQILGETEENFTEKMEEFVPSLFDNLKAKTINGEEITCGALIEFFKSYMAIFNSNSLPEPMTILDATASALNMAFEQKAKDFFDDEIKKNVSHDFSKLDLFEEIISAAIGQALTIFENRPIIGEENAGDAHLANLDQYFQAQHGRLQAMVKQNVLVKEKEQQMESDRIKMEEERLKEAERIKNEEKRLEEEQRIERERIKKEETRLKRERKEAETKIKRDYEEMESKRIKEKARLKREREEAEAKIKREYEEMESKRIKEEARLKKEKEEAEAKIKREYEEMESKRIKEEARLRREREEAEAKIKREYEEMKSKRIKEEARLKREQEERVNGGPVGEANLGPINLKILDLNGGYESAPGRKGLHANGELASVGVANLARVSVGAGSKVGAYADNNGLGFKAEAKYVEADVGPASAKLGLGVSTGIDTKDGFKAELLGTGLGATSKGLEVKVLGSSVGVKWPWKWFD